jgi:hypothetical protein
MHIRRMRIVTRAQVQVHRLQRLSGPVQRVRQLPEHGSGADAVLRAASAAAETSTEIATGATKQRVDLTLS